MPMLEIEGQRVEVGDEFLKLTPEQQQATVNEIAATLKPAAPVKAEAAKPVSKVGLTDIARSAATGVPVLGGLANKANAATAALFSPVIEPLMGDSPENVYTPGSTIRERYAKSLAMQEARDKKFAEESPVTDTAAKIVGGVAGTIPLVLRAPKAFGLVGTLPQQVTRSATSSAGLSAADAAVRGEDVAEAAGVGGALGAAGPLVARGIGKVIDKVRPTPPPTPQHVVKVGDTDIPVRPDQMTGDAAAAAEAESILRGTRGEAAQGLAQQADTATKDALQKATDEIAAKLDPTGAVLKRSPQDAGAQVADELVARETQRAAAEAAAVRAAEAEGAAIRGLGGPARVDSAYDAAETMGAAVQRERDAAVARTRGLYDDLRQEPGTFDPETVTGLAGSIRQRLAAGENPLVVNPQSTPHADRALGVLDSLGGTGLFQHRAPVPAIGGGPVGPVAQAAARAGAETGAAAAAVKTEAEQALEELLAQGVNPERARAAAAKLPGGDRLAGAAPAGEAGAAGGAPGKKAFAEVQEHVRQIGARRDEVQRIIEDNGGKYRTVSGRLVVTPDLEKPGVLRMTYMDGKTPTGHIEGNARELAMEIARHETPRPIGSIGVHEVATADGKTVRVIPRVVEAADVKVSTDAGYPAALQPRDRSRAASDLQVQDMSRNLNPQRLGASSEADRGAPIVGPDMVTESGNGRMLALRQAYREGGEAAQRYRTWLQEQGVDVSKYREPVLVRERATPLDTEGRKQFTVSANQAATLSMSAPERALADSRILTPEVLSLIRNPSDIASGENAEFVRSFMRGLPATERSALITKSGELSAEGVTRVRNAVLGKAYGDSPILARVAESTHDEVKSVSNALIAAAPEWAQLRALINAGEVPAALDVTGDLIDAVARTAAIRGKGVGLAESRAQADAFTQQSPASEALQRLFYDADGKRAATAPKIADALKHYADEAAKVQASPGLDLGLAPVTADDILQAVTKRAGAPAAIVREAAEVAAAAPAPKGNPITEVGLKEMDAARKRLVVMFGDAKRAALGPGATQEDLRAMGRLLHEFDDAIIEAFENGRFSGDSARAAELLRTARASHAAYKQTFASRGPGDEIGRAVEKILGRYTDARATPDEIAALSYGTWAEPGGGKAARVAQRLRTIVGDTSPEWGAHKQGLLSHLMDTPAGHAPLSATARADRIEKFLDGSKGRILSDVMLSRAERDSLRTHARNLRASEPVSVSSLDSADKIIARISGRESGIPMSPGEVSEVIMSKNMRSNKAVAVPLAMKLKRDLSPDSWNAVRQGLWSRTVDAGEGQTQFGSARLASRISDLLSLDVAKVYFTEAERTVMRQMAAAHRQVVMPPGSSNTSNSGHTLGRYLNRASNNLLAMLGAASGGFSGMAAGYAVEKGARALADRRATKDAVRRFYGDQPKRAASSSPRFPIVLSQVAAPQVGSQ